MTDPNLSYKWALGLAMRLLRRSKIRCRSGRTLVLKLYGESYNTFLICRVVNHRGNLRFLSTIPAMPQECDQAQAKNAGANCVEKWLDMRY